MVRRILITGANKGIGLAIAKRCLADHDDTHVIIACRSAQRGTAAIQDLVANAPAWRDRLEVLELDVSSDASVSAAAGKMSDQLYAVVNNAGIASGTLSELFETNVRGPWRVDKAFMPRLGKGSRIVYISSGAAAQCVAKCSDERKVLLTDPRVTWATIDGIMQVACGFPNGDKDLEANGFGNVMGGYGLSKALVNSYTMILAREQPHLLVNSCSPGMIATDLISSMLPSFMPSCVGYCLARNVFGALTPEEGTVAAFYLLFGDLEGNGRFYGSDAKRSPLDKARSPGSPPYEGP